MSSVVLVRSNLVPKTWLAGTRRNSIVTDHMPGPDLMPAVIHNVLQQEPEDDDFMLSPEQAGAKEDDDWSQTDRSGGQKQQRMQTFATVGCAILLVSLLTMKLVAMHRNMRRAEMGYNIIQPEPRGGSPERNQLRRSSVAQADTLARRATDQPFTSTYEFEPPPAIQHLHVYRDTESQHSHFGNAMGEQ